MNEIVEVVRDRAVSLLLCRPSLQSVGSGSDQGGLVVLCLWDWLPVIVNLSFSL